MLISISIHVLDKLSRQTKIYNIDHPSQIGGPMWRRKLMNLNLEVKGRDPNTLFPIIERYIHLGSVISNDK